MTKEHTLDIVYVVREGEENETLRHSLRSLKNLKHGKVFISGYCPKWVKNVIPLKREQKSQSDLENSTANLLQALDNDKLSDDFVLMNDDFFIMEPIEELPIQHQGLLDDKIANYLETRPLQAWSLIKTRDELRRLGVDSLLLKSYELHTPFVYNKKKLKELFDKVELPNFAVRSRTLYGNYYHIGGEQTYDVKTTEPLQQAFQSVQSGRGEPTAAWADITTRLSEPSDYEG